MAMLFEFQAEDDCPNPVLGLWACVSVTCHRSFWEPIGPCFCNTQCLWAVGNPSFWGDVPCPHHHNHHHHLKVR